MTRQALRRLTTTRRGTLCSVCTPRMAASSFLGRTVRNSRRNGWVILWKLLSMFFLFSSFSSSLPICQILSKVDSGEEDKVPRWFATQPAAHQLQGFRWDVRAKCGEDTLQLLMLRLLILDDSVKIRSLRKQILSRYMQTSRHLDPTTPQNHR